MSVSGISSQMGAIIRASSSETIPKASNSGQKQQDLAVQVTVSVMKMAMDQEKAMSKAILDILV